MAASVDLVGTGWVDATVSGLLDTAGGLLLDTTGAVLWETATALRVGGAVASVVGLVGQGASTVLVPPVSAGAGVTAVASGNPTVVAVGVLGSTVVLV
jgi:hypothetical protein